MSYVVLSLFYKICLWLYFGVVCLFIYCVFYLDLLSLTQTIFTVLNVWMLALASQLLRFIVSLRLTICLLFYLNLWYLWTSIFITHVIVQTIDFLMAVHCTPVIIIICLYSCYCADNWFLDGSSLHSCYCGRHNNEGFHQTYELFDFIIPAADLLYLSLTG